MRRIILLHILIICSCLNVFSQAIDIVVDCQTPGWLSSKINYGDQQTVKNLKVTGYINSDDLHFIGSLMENYQLHGRVDLSDANVVGNKMDEYTNNFGLTKDPSYTIQYLALPKSLKELDRCLINHYPGTITKVLNVDTLNFSPDNINYVVASFFDNRQYKSSIKHLILGEKIDSIPDNAFYDCGGVTSLKMPIGMRYIGKRAFYENYQSIKDVNFNELTNLKYIGPGAFCGGYQTSTDYQPDTLIIPKSLDNPFILFAFSYRDGQHIFIDENIKEVSGNCIGSGGGEASGYTTAALNIHFNSKTPPSIIAYKGNNSYTKFGNSTIYVPKGAKQAYLNSDWKNATIIEVAPQTTFNIKASGNGSVSYSGSTIKNQTKFFSIEEGSSVTVFITPDNGHRIAHVKVNGTDVTSAVSNNQYTISNITANTTLDVTFESIPLTTYTLSITATGNGSATYTSTAVRGKTTSFTINEGSSATITFAPDTGYRIASVKVNDTDVTSSVSNNQYTISNIAANTTLAVTFEAIPPTTYTLSITATGNGSATYNSTEVKGKTASFTVTEGTSATITFAPDAGYRIASVKVNGTDVTSSVSNNQYTISNISSNTTLEVAFEAITHTLSITVSGNGSATYNSTDVRGKTQSFTVNEGTSAAITFAPDAGYRIASVKVNGTDVTSSVSNSQYTISNISSNANLEVTFEAITHTLSITATGNGSATYNSTDVRGKTQSFTVNEGTSVIITFTPDTGYRIASVKVNGTDVTSSVSNNQYTISNISSNTTLEVAFEAITHTLSITASGNGSATYNSTDVRGKTQSFTVNEGTSATISFTPDTGYRIASVKVNDTDVTSSVSNSQYTINNITADMTLTVTFEAITHTLSVTATGNGSATYNSTAVRGKTQAFTLNEGSSATVTFSPDAGHRIASVKLNGTDVTTSVANNEYTISNITVDATLSVTFEAITHTLSITSSGNGSAFYNNTTVRNKTELFTINEGTSVTITFTPDAGYRIKSVKLNGTDVTSSLANSQYTISNIKSDNTLVVEFEAIPPTTYTFSITASGNGSATYNSTVVRGKTQSFTVNEGSSATITFTPDAGYRIASIKLNGTDVTSSVVNNKYTISNIKSNTTLAVTFEVIPPTTYTFSITASGNGSATYNGSAIRGKTTSFTVNEGTSATVTFTPDAGYRIASVKLNGTDVTSSVTNNIYTINSITANTTLAVTFEVIPPTTYTLSITASGNGSATYDGTEVKGKTTSFTVTEGTSATITFAPDAGYRIASVKVNDTDVTSSVADNKYTISNIAANTTLAVDFEAIPPTTYTLSITATGNGTATYNSTAVKSKTHTFTVTEGTSATISFTPDAGYRIASVKLNDTNVTSSVADNQYTISNISANTTLAVTFEAIPPTTYTFSITASGNGSATYGSTVVREKTQTFTVNGGTSATISFTPDAGYRIASVKLNDTNVTSSVVDNQYTISNIAANTTLTVYFEVIPPTTYTLSVTASGNGYVAYDGNTIRGKTSSFSVKEATNAVLKFSADDGNRLKSVKVNGQDVTSTVVNNQYAIYNITANTSVEVAFEAVPSYSLNIVASGNGNAVYNGTTIRNQSQSFTLREGSSAIVSFTPNTGYRIKSVKVNNVDVTSQVANGQITIGNIIQDTNVEVTFEEIPPTTYSLTITAKGNGTVTYDGNVVRGGSSTFTVVEGSYATIQITADESYRLKSVILDGKDVTGNVANNQYTTAKITANTTLEVEFVELVTDLAYNGVSYKVVSYDDKTVNVASGNYGLTLTVPATFEAKDNTWTVVGIDSDALANATELAAVIWEPEVIFNNEVSNPNLLLYVKDAQYAPSDIQNVVVGDQAENIVLKDAANGNNFYCPKAFTAKRISYEHHYNMTTGYNTCQGWETIALPFDVTTVLNQKGVDLVPYASWQQGSSQRPFWLYQMTSNGWQAATAIQSNTPYIISMPNNVVYQPSYNQTGYIQFLGSNVEVKASSQLNESQYGRRHFYVSYQQQSDISDIYALNVNNQWSSNTDVSQAVGSAFIRNSRTIHPFEAYMTIEGSNAPWMIPVFDNNMPTNIVEMERMRNVGNEDWYDLQGRKLQGVPKQDGIYIRNGKKIKK